MIAAEPLTLWDRVAVMDSGLLRQVGPPEEIYKKPADLFVATFVGSPRINTIRGDLRTESNGLWFTNGDLKKKVAGPPEHQGKAVVLTVRPEDISIRKENHPDWMECRVYSVLPAGSETIVTVKLGETTMARKINGFTDLKVDDILWIDFDDSQVNYYDPDTEKLIS